MRCGLGAYNPALGCMSARGRLRRLDAITDESGLPPTPHVLRHCSKPNTQGHIRPYAPRQIVLLLDQFGGGRE